MDLIDKLKVKRRIWHISQENMAHKLGITTMTLNRYENKKRSMPVELLYIYAKELKCEIIIIDREF